MDEFGLIARYFAPLAKNFSGSLNLADDAAIIDIPAGHELIVTKDAIAQGVHFIGDEDPALIAKKLLRVNLSDLAAMGATPSAHFLALMLPADTPEDWVARFAEGLGQDQEEFSIALAGGDTVATKGPLACSLTALGTVKKGTALKRSGAKAGDTVFVSGALGDSVLGLHLLQNTAPDIAPDDAAFLIQRYQLPEPRIALGQQLVGIASACMDISDGLVQDLGHLCTASQVSATIEAKQLPLSPAAQRLLELMPELKTLPLTGGDDYELLFTMPPENLARMPAGCTRIGTVGEGNGVIVLDDRDQPLAFERTGYRHF